jgi:hypothetical protein
MNRHLLGILASVTFGLLDALMVGFKILAQMPGRVTLAIQCPGQVRTTKRDLDHPCPRPDVCTSAQFARNYGVGQQLLVTSPSGARQPPQMSAEHRVRQVVLQVREIPRCGAMPETAASARRS